MATKAKTIVIENFKPNWSNAPSWANWAAVDGSGELYFFSDKPVHSVYAINSWNNAPSSKYKYGYKAFSGIQNWQDMLFEKPSSGTAAEPGSNKPDWADAPSWAMWLACDGLGDVHERQWWWFEKEPKMIVTGPHKNAWKNTGGHAENSDKVAPEDWANDNWTESLLQRPQPEPESPNKKRVTLFIEFSGPVDDDEQLAQNVAEMLCNRLGHEPEYTGKKFTPGYQTVDRIKVAVGTTKLCEVVWEEGNTGDIPSNYNVKGLKK